jgi:Zn-dependent peptidase ImmA (M78 family)
LPKAWQELLHGREIELGYGSCRVIVEATSTGSAQIGSFMPDGEVITLSEAMRSSSTVCHVLFHELAHAILFEMGFEDLYSNEPFVENLGRQVEAVCMKNAELLTQLRKF